MTNDNQAELVSSFWEKSSCCLWQDPDGFTHLLLKFFPSLIFRIERRRVSTDEFHIYDEIKKKFHKSNCEEVMKDVESLLQNHDKKIYLISRDNKNIGTRFCFFVSRPSEFNRIRMRVQKEYRNQKIRKMIHRIMVK